MQEIDIRLNKLEYTNAGTVTTTPQTILELFTDIPAAAKANMKTMVVYNNSSADIFFGKDNTVSATTGAIINLETARELPMHDINGSPYFMVASGTSELRIEIWS